MILVVGGAGYIGSHAVKELLKEGHDVIIFDNLSTGHKQLVSKKATFALGDLANIDHLRLVFKQYPITAVMHFAANAYVGESVINPQKYYLNNVKNTLNLLQVMLEFNVESFVFSSTCATYGVPKQLPMTENHVQKPINPYGRTKWMVEQILQDYSATYPFHYVALRYFNAAGADVETEIGEWHEPETHLIPLILDTAIGNREYISVFGDDYDTKDGTCIRDYIHVTDLAQAHILALSYLQQTKQSDVFNLGNGEGFSVFEIIDIAKKVTGKDIPVKIEERRAVDPDKLVGSAQKAVEQLGWKPQYNKIETIISSAWAWHQKLQQLKK